MYDIVIIGSGPAGLQPQFMHSVKTLKRLWLKKNLWVRDRLPRARE